MKVGHVVLSILLIGILFITSGCDDVPRHFNTYVELNGDGKPEIIFGNYEKQHWGYRDYDLMTKFSTEGPQAEPRLIQRFRDRPDQISFTDIDGDGNLDLIFSAYGKQHWGYRDYDTYVAKNDGSGNFGIPELINRQKK